MDDSTVSDSGEIKIPDAILAALGLKPGDRIVFTVLADRTVVFRPKNRSLADIAGMLHEEGRPPVPIEKMSPWD